MKKITISVALLLISISYNAQVGVNTELPLATLDIREKRAVSSNANDTSAKDGVMIPKLTKTELASKTATAYTAAQNGTIIYVSDATGGTTGTSVAQVTNINAIGFYYLDAAVWKKLDTDTNLYNIDGSLSGNRIVTQGANTLAFTGTTANAFSVDGTTLSVDANNDRVGVGTISPNSSLDVAKSAVNPTTSVDGIKAPILTKLELATKTATTYGVNQKSTLVYVSDISGTIAGASASQVQNVINKGYYYFDDTIVNTTAPNGRWVSLYDPSSISIPIVNGTMVNFGNSVNINPQSQVATPLKSYIILGPGKWLVTVNILLFANSTLRDATTMPWFWARLAFNDGVSETEIQTKTAQSADLIGSKLISGSFMSPPTVSQRPTYVYSVISGQVVINNTSAGNKYYGLMWWGSETNNNVGTYQFTNVSTNNNAENSITAMKIQ